MRIYGGKFSMAARYIGVREQVRPGYLHNGSAESVAEEAPIDLVWVQSDRARKISHLASETSLLVPKND
jgi:hypothetical protein